MDLLQSPWVVAAGVLLGLVLIFAGSWLHLRYWVRRLTVSVEYASEDRIPTPDGSAIELRRVPRPDAAAEHAGVGLPPVLLVHGLAANHRNFDAHPDASLARHLARAGRDVWLLTLRSGRIDRRAAEDRLVRFSAMADHDLPIAVRAVLEKTGAPQLDYIGFSMGGMLLYASIGKTIEERVIRRAAVVGSPGRVRSPIPFTGWFAGFVPKLFVPGMWFRLVARFWAFASEWVPATPLQRIVYNPRNVAAGGTRGALVNVIVDVPASLNHDFVRWVARGGKVTHHGDDVLERVRGVRVPCLFIAGAGDRIAPPQAVHAAFDAWSKDHPETPKTFVVLGRETGATHDYGHGDLAIGMAVQQDVFDPLERFLRAEPLGGAVPA